ncbi:MAG: hypothetical protein TREMPRED_000911 [Tremellales sp. Tagirdzhanova-0007]|nr:MAG: hypothetical protein TREMPRED_000911 [Tremellales sp. Tagirdzhanova-0007]
MVVSTSPSAPLIVVFGATGKQGGSVIDHLAASKREYRIKGVTRSASKLKETKLAEPKLQVIEADLMSKDGVTNAIEGANAVFCVTTWLEAGIEAERQQGVNIIEAIQATKPQPLLLFSGLPHITDISKGKYSKVEHFDSKAEIYEKAKSAGLKVVSVEPAFYMENFLKGPFLAKQEDGNFIISFPLEPTRRLAVVNARRDYGAFVVGALESNRTDGRVYAATDELTLAELAIIWGQETSTKCNYVHVPSAKFQSKVGEQLSQMIAYIGEFGYYGGAELKTSQELVSGTRAWKEFVSKSDWSGVIA